MITFFAKEKTRELLQDRTVRKVLLVGGFHGYWNFGDLVQLAGTVRWYACHLPEATLFPVVYRRPAHDPRTLKAFEALLGVNNWLMYSSAESVAVRSQARRLEFQRLDPAEALGSIRLHAYGGGLLNRYWGDSTICLLETVMEGFSIESYLMSGQQIGPECADRLARHSLRWRPQVVGCRDVLSAQMLKDRGVNSLISGDDAFEELVRVASTTLRREALPLELVRFGLHLNLAPYTRSVDNEQDHEALEAIGQDLRLLKIRFGESCRPLLIGAYLADPQGPEETWVSIARVGLARHFPAFEGIDLVGLFLQGRLDEGAASIRSTELVVSHSYHVALFAQLLGVPSYLVARNNYYRQKRLGLQTRPTELKEFLEIDRRTRLGEQDSVLKGLAQARKTRLDSLKWEVGPGSLRRERPQRRGVAMGDSCGGGKSPSRVMLVASTDWSLLNSRLSLAREIRRQGFEPVLLTPCDSDAPLSGGQDLRWIRWEWAGGNLNPWSELKSLLGLICAYRCEKPVLVHHFTTKAIAYGSLAANLTGVPAVVNQVTGRGPVFSRPGFRSWIVRQVVKAFNRLALSHPNSATIFENPLDKADFLSQGLANEARAWLIEGPGIDVNYFSPVPEPAGPITIGFLAGLQWDNGVGTFVEAARTLRKDMEARFVLVGVRDSGNPAAVSRALLDQWLEEGVVEWWGAPTMEKKSLYGRCHVIAFPTSCDDAVPTVLLEAAASGRPVVASSVPGCQNVVLQGETGLLVPPGDARELAAALARLIQDREMRRRMGETGRRMAVDRFAESKINSATFQVYRDLLRGSAKEQVT